MSLTARQTDVLNFVRKHFKSYHCAPTRKEIGEALGMSRPTAELHLQALRDAGLIVLRTQWRGIFLRDGIDIDAAHKRNR